MRASGILMPVSSLPSKYGIGSFTKEAYDWIDFLKKSGQTFWQILPLGPTGFGDSPYQSVSSYAGNPYFISLEDLIKEGYLTQEECDAADLGDDPVRIDYAKMYNGRYPLLRKAYENSKGKLGKAFDTFVEEQKHWLEDYALFMAIKGSYNGGSWDVWDEKLRIRDEKALAEKREELKDDVLFYEVLQYWFHIQWTAIKAYANENGIKIIGDIPIYVAFDSVDAWSHPEVLQFDKDLMPVSVAGCPPDAFSDDGQLWGNPLYNWKALKKDKYGWWIQRIKRCAELCDILRIDHFRAFDEYFAIPYGSKNAKKGKWEKGPGMALFKQIAADVPEIEIIAEDLGMLTDSVYELLDKTGFPGMKVLQFAFGSGAGNLYLPHNYKNANYVVYTGTHDNETLMQFISEMKDETREHIKNYLNRYWDTYEQLCDNLVRLAYMSIAKYCITCIQDYLHLGADARINFPSTTGTNWQWRLLPDQIPDWLPDYIHNLAEVSGRLPEVKKEEKEAETEETADSEDGKEAAGA